MFMISVNFAAFNIPPDEYMKLLKELGFGAIILWGGDCEYNRIYNCDMETVADKAQKEGLSVEQVHSPYIGSECNVLWRNGEAGEHYLRSMFDLIAFCGRQGIPAIILHLSFGDSPPPVNPVGLDRLKRLVETAERHGVYIVLENLERPDYIRVVLDSVEGPLKFCYDSGHWNCFSKGREDVLAEYGHLLFRLHLHDNDQSGDQHLLPGDGNIDWEHLCGQIKVHSYTGPVTLEIAPYLHERYAGVSPADYYALAAQRGRWLETLLFK